MTVVVETLPRVYAIPPVDTMILPNNERQLTMITLNGIEIEVSELGVCQCWDCDRGKPWKCANEEEEE